MRDAVLPWVWVAWIIVLVVSFAIFEGFALATGRTTLSRTVWTINKNFPPFGWMCGLVVGFLAAHFFWVGQGCDLVTKSVQ